MGAVLTPALVGVGEAGHLPNATSFCGRCESVCPVKIPLTRIMRYWRNEAFARGIPSSVFNIGLRLWSSLALRPRLYGTAGRIAAGVMRLIAGRHGRLRSR